MCVFVCVYQKRRGNTSPIFSVYVISAYFSVCVNVCVWVCLCVRETWWESSKALGKQSNENTLRWMESSPSLSPSFPLFSWWSPTLLRIISIPWLRENQKRQDMFTPPAHFSRTLIGDAWSEASAQAFVAPPPSLSLSHSSLGETFPRVSLLSFKGRSFPKITQVWWQLSYPLKLTLNHKIAGNHI